MLAHNSRWLVAALAIVLASARAASAEQPAVTRTTYTYKTVGDVPIQADVYRPNDTKQRPAVVWLHGGALITGNRDSVPGQIKRLCREEGYVLVSFDYRLAPETKLPAIVEDVEDAFRWLREQGPNLLHVDVNRIVVTGGSAGGYLTLLSGQRLKARPQALVAYWGYGDIVGDWYTQSSDFYSKQTRVEKDVAYRGVGKGIPTGASGASNRSRSRFYLYLRQNGLWTREVGGYDPKSEEGSKKLEAYCPVRNVSADYPPTLLIHGTEDTDVPYEQSATMAKELARQKIPHELITVPGAGHGLAGGDKDLVDAAHDKALAFIRAHLK